MTPLSPDERAMIDRIQNAPKGVTGVATAKRIEIVQGLARRGLVRCWWGEGRDQGVLLVRMATGAVIPPGDAA